MHREMATLARIDNDRETSEFDGMVLKVRPRNVSLTAENESFILDLVASGRFGNASEVVRAALRLLEDKERHLTASVDKPKRRGKTRPSLIMTEG